MRIKKAIVKRPSKSMIHGLTTQNLGPPDYKLAVHQHEEYIKALEKGGVKTIVLDADEMYPDSCFVEDTAILTEDFAVITNPGAESRKGEIISIEEELKKHYNKIFKINPSGTLDGGDVLRAESKFFIGLSERTNEDGAGQLKKILESAGFEVFFVKLKKYLHLKTGVSYIGGNTLILAGELIDEPVFREFDKIIVNPEEEYSANSIRVNDYLFIAKGFPKIKAKLLERGFKLIELEMSEFRKIDGGLSCLSLRF